MYIASQTGQFTIARALIQKNVDVNVKTSSGDTACHVALRNGYAAIANLITEQQQQEQQQLKHLNPLATLSRSCEKKVKPNQLHLPAAPTIFKPKSPYAVFFERFSEFPKPGTNLEVPEVIVDNVDGVGEAHWFPSPTDITRYSPEGIESAMDAFNPFNAWPGTSMIFKQAVHSNGTGSIGTQHPAHFKKSISKPVSTVSKLQTPASPLSPWSPSGERYPVVGSNDTSHFQEAKSVKLPKDLSSVLANLGLAKYQMHFEEQDIDLQVTWNKLTRRFT